MPPTKLSRRSEQAAWDTFLAACPLFAGVPIADYEPGPEPPDVLCETVTRQKIGVELRGWLEAKDVAAGAKKASRQDSTRKIVASQNVPRPEHIGMVRLKLKSTIKRKDASAFRHQLFELLNAESAKPPRPSRPPWPITAGYWSTVRSWDTDQGGKVTDFTHPALQQYLDEIFILPRSWTSAADAIGSNFGAGTEWVVGEPVGGAYNHETMVQAAVDSILEKVNKYAASGLRTAHSLTEFHLLCHYIDQTVMYNPPPTTAGFSLADIAEQVKQKLTGMLPVFDKIFILYPYEEPKVLQVYP